MMHGCDLSRHNPIPSSFTPWSFAFVRVSYGLSIDERAESHVARARASHPMCLLGAYHYLELHDGAQQADLLLTREAILGGSMLLAVDAEDLPAPAEPYPRAAYAVQLLAFVRRVIANGRRLFVYLSSFMCGELFRAAPVTMREVARLTLLWLADWTPPYPTPEPWVTHAILQTGVAGGFDHDVFDGTLDELRALGGIDEISLAQAERPTLRTGDTGPAVHALQRLLNVIGAGLRTDGIFGRETRAAVQRLQREHGLTVDGIVGPATWTALLTPR